MPTPIDKITGIGPATATLLANHDIHSAEDLAAQRIGDLAAIKGFSTIRAGQVIAAAIQLTGSAGLDSHVQAAEPDKKTRAKNDKVKKDKKKKKNKEKTKKQQKGEKNHTSKADKSTAPKKNKDKHKPEKSKKKRAQKK